MRRDYFTSTVADAAEYDRRRSYIPPEPPENPDSCAPPPLRPCAPNNLSTCHGCWQMRFCPHAWDGKHFVNDDHVPLRNIGKIPTCDIIDFDYPYWHTSQDTQDKVSAESLERVGRVLERLLEGESPE